MVRLFISNGSNTVALLTQTLPSVIAGEEPIVGDVIAAYKSAVSPELDGVSIIKLSLHLPLGVTRSDSALDDDCFLT
ncbi:UNVERIFIED_CONTAM: hypothetical protein HDU68_011941, partial [Siphonaria sp. JEL0065]